jgi:hypothetical protein
VSELASIDEPRKRLAGIISGLNIHYDLGNTQDLLAAHSRSAFPRERGDAVAHVYCRGPARRVS